jgi:hypothetical protein
MGRERDLVKPDYGDAEFVTQKGIQLDADEDHLLIANPWHEPRRQGSPRQYRVKRKPVRVLLGLRFYQTPASVLAVTAAGEVLTECVTADGCIGVLQDHGVLAKPSMEIGEALLDILHRTHDGDQLSHLDLQLVERAVNAGEGISVSLQALVADLHARCVAGYTLPAFHGLAGLTIRQSGHVDWKGHNIEHYDLQWAYTAEGKASAQRLHAKCLELEVAGIEVPLANLFPSGRKARSPANPTPGDAP